MSPITHNIDHPVLIGFSSTKSPFEELWPGTHKSLLPLLGKPIVVHLIERLRNQGYRHFRVARHLQQTFIQNRLGDGHEWGVRISYSDLEMGALLSQSLAEFCSVLVVRADEVLFPIPHLACPQVCKYEHAIEDAKPGYYCLDLAGGVSNYAPFPDSATSPICSAADYLLISFEHCLELSDELTIPGAKIHRDAQADWGAHFASDVLVGANCYVGKHCEVSQGAVLESNCVLGNGVFIDQSARLKNCVVLPNTYIGENVKLRDCIVSAKGALHVGGEFIRVKDATVLTHSRHATHRSLGVPISYQTFV